MTNKTTKELFTKEVIDESKKRIYSTIEKIKEEIFLLIF